MRITKYLIGLCLLCFGTISWAACRDAVVLVHGNGASPSSWSNTYTALINQGYQSSDIFQPDWGSKTCAACNNHSGSEETPVRNALIDAINQSCTGKVDVIGHSMGVTLAIQQIDKLNTSTNIDSFVGIAGASRGLRSCGTYPFNVWTSTCGYYGLSVNSPLLNGIANVPIASKVYSIKSYTDQIVCSTGICTVGGVHASQIQGEHASFTYVLGHFGLQSATVAKQLELIQ